MTILGITGAANYYYFSNSKMIKDIPAYKPKKTIFEPYFLSSLFI